MMIVRLSSRGRIVIPKNVRDRLGLRAGDALTVCCAGDEIRCRRAAPLPATRVGAVAGMLHGAVRATLGDAATEARIGAALVAADRAKESK